MSKLSLKRVSVQGAAKPTSAEQLVNTDTPQPPPPPPPTTAAAAAASEAALVVEGVKEMTSLERFQQIIRQIDSKTARSCVDDSKDILTRDPSYTDFKLPFQQICHRRYHASRERYLKQLRKEIKRIIDWEPRAIDHLHLFRIFTINSYWPPMFSKREIEQTHWRFFVHSEQLTPKERNRVHYLLGTKNI